MTTQDYWILNNGIIKFITYLKGWEQDDEWCDKFYEMYNPEEWGELNGFEDNRKEEECCMTQYKVALTKTDNDNEDRVLTDIFECPMFIKEEEEIIEWIENNECISIDYIIKEEEGDESEEDKLDIKVLGFKTTDRLDGDWNSLLFEIRNQEIISVSDEIIKKKKIIKKKIIKKGLTNEEKKIKEDIRLMYDYNLPVKEARKVEDLLNQLNFDSLYT
tara:strand:+ start:2961 stop:3611 length:651 start_codon:yes stop_codon:yes gene_type:complete